MFNDDLTLECAVKHPAHSRRSRKGSRNSLLVLFSLVMHRAVCARGSSLASPMPVMWSICPCESSFGVDLENHCLSVMSQCDARLPPIWGPPGPIHPFQLLRRMPTKSWGTPRVLQVECCIHSSVHSRCLSQIWGQPIWPMWGVVSRNCILGAWIMEEGVWLVGRDLGG